MVRHGGGRLTFPGLLFGLLLLEGQSPGLLTHELPIFFAGNLSFVWNLLNVEFCSSAQQNILRQPLSWEHVFSGFVSESGLDRCFLCGAWGADSDPRRREVVAMTSLPGLRVCFVITCLG